MKKILLLLVSVVMIFALTSCGEPAIVGYHIDDNGKLIATLEDETTVDLGTLSDTIANGVDKIEIDENGYYVINDVKTDIKAKLAKSYSIDKNGNLVVTYTDTTTENLGKFGADAINTIDTISISDDGFYVLNGIKTDIVAVDVFEVNFVTDYSATLKTQIVKDGDKVGRPQLERDGYTLVGWYCNGEEWRFNSDIVLNDMTLTAEWTPNDYSVSFETGIDTDLLNQTITFDSEYSLPTLEQTGYTFKGWEYEGCLVTESKWNIAENCTLVAKWEVNTYTVTLDPNGGSVLTTTKKIVYGQEYTLPVPTNDFGVFKGWYYNDQKITDADGKSLEKWYFTDDITVSTSWTIDIYNAKDLLNVKNTLNGYYILANDIDLGGIEWTPIADFTGVFDGNGFVISDFKITIGQEYIGLFSSNRGEIKNLGIENFEINVTHSDGVVAGGLIGRNLGKAFNCYANGNVFGQSIYSTYHTAIVGGLVGDNQGQIEKCYTLGEVNSSFCSGGISGHNNGAIISSYSKCNIVSNSHFSYYSYAGGLVGDNNGTIAKSYAEGNVSIKTIKISGYSTYGSYAGGLVGINRNSISNCYAIGNVDNSTENSILTYSGGLVGWNENVTVENCYATGDVEATSYSNCKTYAGGLIGSSKGILINCYATGKVTSYTGSYSSGGSSLSGGGYYPSYSKTYVGGLVADNYGTITNCYRCNNQITNDSNQEFNAGIEKTTEELQSTAFQVTYLQWSSEIWDFVNEQHPTIKAD